MADDTPDLMVELVGAQLAAARKALKYAWVLLAVAVVVLVLDQQIKRAVVDKAREAQVLLDRAAGLVMEVRRGTTDSASAGRGAGDQPGGNGDRPVDAGAGVAASAPEGRDAWQAAQYHGRPGAQGGAAGDE